MATKNMRLPKIVLTESDYRFVAIELTNQAEGEHQDKWIIDVGDEDPLCVKIVAEMRTVDSLDQDRWNKCTVREAGYNILKGQVKRGLLPVTPMSKSAKK